MSFQPNERPLRNFSAPDPTTQQVSVVIVVSYEIKSFMMNTQNDAAAGLFKKEIYAKLNLKEMPRKGGRCWCDRHINGIISVSGHSMNILFNTS